MARRVRVPDPPPAFLNNADLRAKVGKRLRRLRHEAGLTVDQLAARAGIAPNTLGNLERGTRDTQWAKFARVIQALGAKIESLIRDDELFVSPGRHLDPKLLNDLLAEDLEIAQLYHHSPTTLRQSVRRALKAGEIVKRLMPSGTELERRLNRLSARSRYTLDLMVTQFEQADEQDDDDQAKTKAKA